MDELDYSDIEAKYHVPLDESLDNVIIIHGVPVITPAKEQRLVEAIQKRFRTQAELEVPLEYFHIPYGDGGESKGYVIAELADVDEAVHAIRTMDGYAFDKKHRFAVNRFTDIERLAELDETFVEPEQEEYQQRGNLRSWLADPACRDQLAMCHHDDVQIGWHNKSSQPEIVHSRTRWTESYVQWSPHGTYLATFHLQGIALWGGAAWERIMRYPHPGVRLVDFSPDEKYMVTWAPEPIQVPENAPQGPQFFSAEDQGNRVAIWDVRTGHLLRTFAVVQEESAAENGAVTKGFSWPFLKWSGDSQYCAKVTPGKFISVYEPPRMGLLDHKSIKIDGVVDFEWCPLGDKDKETLEIWNDRANRELPKSFKKPRDNMLCYWQPEMQNQPARVAVMSIPKRELLRSKNLFNVADCKLHWHPQGDYLCVKVDRQTRTKKTVFSNFEIFRMREKDFPVETIELKDPVMAFAWEPQGSHFSVISTNDPNFGIVSPGISLKTQLLFYHLHPRGNFRQLKAFDNKTCNALFWSPRGKHLLAATLGSTQKFDLEWYDVDFNSDVRQNSNNPDLLEEVKMIGNAEHYSITDVEWDPSGRYVTTSASLWRRSTEHGYAIWDFRGTELQKHVLDQFKQILWRPRPRSLLSKDEQKRVRRNLREFSKVFDQEDEAEQNSQALAHREVYQRMVEEWKAWREKNRRLLEEAKKELGTDTVGPSAQQLQKESTEEIHEWIEEVLEETEEVL
ncbi:Translation initiation factor 3 subunit b [Malassezia vespertilionis]|uniref:Eukaryotic translation initiation factor 3 subunit B n=1 Tax=Malassezia vespertilionis TaxID=2020962 RepID=A0A2N1J765_9BASI|nr:Translation initiation factor 3 subunit b [Malassezia vespertilionis]PKI82384.1 Prt1p [Malassezia vespertilionis]WFD07984.1 Translation initiation factor 3 subunit b [Malassezia vespertilionis]